MNTIVLNTIILNHSAPKSNILCDIPAIPANLFDFPPHLARHRQKK